MPQATSRSLTFKSSFFSQEGVAWLSSKYVIAWPVLNSKFTPQRNLRFFLEKKIQPSDFNYQMQSFCQSKVDLNYQLFLTSSIKMIIDKNHAMLWSFVTPFIWWMMGFLCVPSHPLLFCSYFLRDHYTRPLAKNKDVLSRGDEPMHFFSHSMEFGPTFGSARIDPWNRSCER